MIIPEKYLNSLNKIITKKEYINERDEIVTKLVERLNKEREGTIYEKKPLTKRGIAVIINKKFGGNNYTLNIFLAKCQDCKGFSSKFWWALKNK